MATSSRKVLLLVHELHKMGYQQLRIAPGMSPSGMYWRCSIAPAISFSRSNGAILDRWDAPAAHYTSGQENKYFDWEDAERDSPRKLAHKFWKRFPEIIRLGNGSDWEYVGWYLEMLRLTESNGLPIAYADWDLPSGCLAVVGNSKNAQVPLPPSVTVHIGS